MSKWPKLKAYVTVPLLLALAACGGSAPEESWEVAVKGTYSAALSPDGQYAVIGSITHGGSLWSTRNKERLFDWNHKQGNISNIIAAGFSHDGKFALTADHQTIVLWNTATGNALTYWTAPNEVMSVELTPNGNYALLGLEDYSMVLFDVKRGGIQRTFYHQDRVLDVALNTAANLAISGSEDQTAKLWDVNSGELLHTWEHQQDVSTVALSPSGDKALTVAKYDKAVIWNTASGKAIGELPLHSSAIKRGQVFISARFSENGNLLLTGNSDRLVQLWDTKALTELASWSVPKRDPWKPTSASIVAVGFSAKSKQYYAVASNGFIHRLTRQ